METYEVDAARKRRRHLRVSVFPNETQAIEENAKRAGMGVARYLREVGQGYKIIDVVDYEHVRELARINGDLSRLGGLLKLWLTDDPRTARFGDATVQWRSACPVRPGTASMQERRCFRCSLV